jgi:hypothetical protein
MIEDHPELHRSIAAVLIVMMVEPGLCAHREACADDQDSDMFEKIEELCRD